MHAKKIVTILLVLFAAAGVGYAIFGGKAPVQKDSPPETPGAVTASDGLTVYYFHTTFRCHSCLTIERLTHETLNEQFAVEQKSGAIRWRMVNYEEPANEHFIDDYKLYTKQVILSAVKGGKEVKWKNLDEVWDLKRDEMRFKLYIADEIKKFRAENGL
ncbi:MAG TPA: nitrophenyl compound nitroreductase subunit ArsF family protein [bacterium]|nr:nitrophenyl compound nitroreductase subunit ArsF family protein [bacterium]